MPGVRLTFAAGDAPMGGQDTINLSVPTTLANLKTAAATAVSTNGGLIDATKAADANGNTEAILFNVSRIIQAVALP